MDDLAQRLLKTIRKQEFLRPGDRVAVAVSGGADSVALLHLLLELRSELGIVLSVAHVNHKLRGTESDDDQRFVAALAAAQGLEFHVVEAPVPENRVQGGTDRANSSGQSLHAGVEAAARELRYAFFCDLARDSRATKIATAHTLDDQAETVLLRLFRGTGIRGLAGVHPRIIFRKDERCAGELVRPLLSFRRLELRDYLRSRSQPWREDSSNLDVSFLRNRVRSHLLPLIAEEFGEPAIEHMAELAEIARAEEEWAADQGSSRIQNTGPELDIGQLLAMPLAAARRLVRNWIEANASETRISFRLIEEILDLARGPAGKKVELSCAGGSNILAARPTIIRRGRNGLVLESSSAPAGDYQYALPIPGEVLVPEIGARIEAQKVNAEELSNEEDRDQLLDPAQVGTTLLIRNWRAGDRYWPAHTASEKKVKELLSDRHATGAEKKLWPVALAENGTIVWLRGFAVPAALRAAAGTAIRIR